MSYTITDTDTPRRYVLSGNRAGFTVRCTGGTGGTPTVVERQDLGRWLPLGDAQVLNDTAAIRATVTGV